MNKFTRRQSGATLVEMAIIAPVFLLVLVSLIELSMMFFATLTMQYAVREGARFAITGQSTSDGYASNQQRYATVIAKIRDNSLGMYDKLNTQVVVNGTAFQQKEYSNAMFGAAGSVNVVQLNCEWTLTTPLLGQFFTNGKYSFSVATTMRNEFF